MASPNTPRARKAAIEQFVEPLRRATNKFVDGRLIYETPELGAEASIMLNNIEQPTMVPVRNGFQNKLKVLIQLSVKITEDSDGLRVTTVGYIHTLWVNGEEKLSYHWHPLATPAVAFPHLHYDKGHEHIPTGRVLVEDILLAALEFGAKPKPGWKNDVLEACEAFEADATWGKVNPKTGPLVRADWLNRWDDEGNPKGEGL